MATRRTRPSRSAAPLTAGVDLGGTKIQVVVLNGEEVAGTARTPTPADTSAAVIEAIAGAVRTAAEQSGGKIAAVGVGAPGKIDGGAVVDAHNVRAFEPRVELGQQLGKALGGLAVVLDNDVRSGIYGEHRLGAGRPYRNLFGVWLGTGVGGGVIVENQLLEGQGAAGEIGHMVVKDGGRRCSCGRRGCLEAYAGRGCMEARARKLAKRGEKTALFEIMEKLGRDRLTSGVFARALKRGDSVAENLIDDARWALGLALASAQNLLSAEAIVIGGGLGDRLGAAFAAEVLEAMRPHLFISESPPAVLTSKLGDLAGAVGAALRARESLGG